MTALAAAIAGGFGGSSPRAGTVYHGCITSPVWHWRDVGVTVQWTNDHVPSRLTSADP